MAGASRRLIPWQPQGVGMTYARLAAMDADQLAAWVCLHPNPNRAEREALARLLEEMPFQGRALVLGGAA